MNEQREQSLVERLTELAKREDELSHDCDCPPESTANFRYAKTLREAINCLSEEQSKVETLRDSMRLDAQTMAAKDRKIEDLEQIVASYALTWSATDGYDPERPKDGETVLGWWPANLPGYRGGMESVTFGAADEDGRSDTWTNAFGDSTDAPDYWARVKGPK